MDGIRELRKGETLDGIPADTWNAFVRCLKIVDGIKRQGNTPGIVSNALPSIEVFNKTGSDITARWPILKLDAPALTIDNGEHVVDDQILFNGTTPVVSTPIGEIAVLQGPVLNNDTRDAVFVGPTWCEIDVTDDTHQFARAGDADNTKFESGTTGAKILWKEGGTGTKKAVVMLGGGSADEGVRYVLVITAGFIPPGTPSAPGDGDSGSTTFTISKFDASVPAIGYQPVSFPAPTTHHIQNPFPYAANEGTYAIDYVGPEVDTGGGHHEFWRIIGFDMTGLENWVAGDFQVIVHEIGQPPSWGDASTFVGPQGPQGIQGVPGNDGPTYTAGCGIDVTGTVISINRPNLLGSGLAADSGTCNIKVTRHTANIGTAINAGSASAPVSGSGTVYRVAADGTTTSLGAKTIWNPFNHKVKGAASVGELDSNNYLLRGCDLLEALYLLTGVAEEKVLGLPSGANDPTDIQWLGECLAIVVSVACVDNEIEYTTANYIVITCTP